MLGFRPPQEHAFMHRIFLWAVLALGPALATAQSPAPDEAALKALLVEFLDGAGRSDAAVHDRFWAEDLVYTRSAGVRLGKAELMQGLRDAPAPKAGDPVSVFSAEDVRVQQYGDAAVVAFRLVGTTTHGGSTEITHYLNTGTFVKRDGRWQAVAWQSTRVPPDVADAAE
jgi:ketosteroid isomerase-like protein